VRALRRARARPQVHFEQSDLSLVGSMLTMEAVWRPCGGTKGLTHRCHSRRRAEELLPAVYRLVKDREQDPNCPRRLGAVKRP
jgi:hypothetical protein